MVGICLPWTFPGVPGYYGMIILLLVVVVLVAVGTYIAVRKNPDVVTTINTNADALLKRL